MEQKRIGWIDGLKGLACIFIVFHHFLMGYYPAAYSGDYAYSHMASGADVAFAQSPLAFFTIGDLWVAVFCMISGFVIARQVYNMTEEKQFSKALLKRYPRLMLPVFCLSAIVFVMLWFGLFYNTEAAALTHSEWLGLFYHDKPGVLELLTDSLIDNWLVGLQLVYSNGFWMLKDLFVGSFVAYLLAAMGKNHNKQMLWGYLFICLAYLSVNSRIADFAMGVLLAFLVEKFPIDKLKIEKPKVLLIMGWILLVIGFFLGAYPVEAVPTNGYRYLAGLQSFWNGRLIPYLFYHKIAAFTLIMGIYLLPGMQKILETKMCRFLGQISYAVYLVHIPILFSATGFIFVKLSVGLGRYNVAATITLLLTIGIVLLIAWLFHRYPEKYCEKITNRLVQWLIK